MAEIKELRIKEPNPALVHHLKRMLGDAETGNLQGLVGVAIFDNSTTDQFWYDTPKWYHTCVLADRIIGALERCKYKLLRLRVWAEDDEEMDG